MSVTFSVPEAPKTTKTVTCDYGQGEAWACRMGNRCGYCQDGFERVTISAAPEVNVANVTARVLFGIVGMPDVDLMGSLSVEHIPSVRRGIIKALSTSLPERQALPARSYGGEGTGHARVIDCGLDAERIREHLLRFDAVLVYAQEHGQEVSWG